MKNSAKHLVRYLLDNGYKIYVGDEEGEIQKTTFVNEKIMNAINSVDECILRVYRGSEKVGTAYITNLCNPEESVYDYTDNDLFNEWSEIFNTQL